MLRMAQQRRRAVSSPYDVHPSVPLVQKWLATLREQTGRTLAQWCKLIEAEGPESEKDRRAWLKSEYELGGNTAWSLAERSVGKGFEGSDPDAYLQAAARYVESMYAGAKAALRPIHDSLLEVGRGLGADVRVCPCKTIVPLYRRHVFAQVKPSTRTRIDLGLCLREQRMPARVIETGGEAKGDRITHRIEISSIEDVDADIEFWMRRAYDLDE